MAPLATLIPGRKDDQCSKRYNDILNPSAKNRLSDWTPQEDSLLRQGVATLGHRWAAISSRIPGRPPLTCRNRWRTLSRHSHSRDGTKSQGNTPSSSTSHMSPIAPAPQNLNIDMEPGSGNAAEQIMPFSAMEAEAGGEQTRPSFLDSAFYEAFPGAGPSPPSLHDADGENADKVDGAGVPPESVLLGDLSSTFSDQTQTAKQWSQPRPSAHTRHRQDSATGAFMPSPSSWSSMSSLVATGTSPPADQSLWLGSTGASSVAKNWGIPGNDAMLQSYAESFQLPPTTQQTVHHHHHHHVHHHFHHYHHYSGEESWRQLERQSEAEAMQSHAQDNSRQSNSG